MRDFIMVVYTRVLLLLLGASTLFCCKSEPSIHVYSDDSEAQFFEDYESPRFKWGLLDPDGNEILAAQYDEIKDPIDLKHIPASLKGKWSYVDTNGKPLVPHQFKSVEQWSDGVGWARNFDDTYQIVSANNISDTIVAEAVRPFSHGVAAIKKNGRWQYIDKKGKQAIPTSYNRAGQFVNNQAIIQMPQGYGVIDNSGNYVVEPAYAKIKQDINGYIAKDQAGYRYLSMKGNSRWKQSYEQASAFKGERALVKNDGKYHLIDQAGTVVKSLPYQYVLKAGQGYWKYMEDDLWGILDTNGNVIKSPTYIDCYEFEEGHLVAAIGKDQWGIVNENMETIVPFQYPLLWSFKNGYARIIEDGYIQVINTDGELLPNIKEIELRDFHNGLARFQKYPRIPE